jgi:hypothetical protein
VGRAHRHTPWAGFKRGSDSGILPRCDKLGRYTGKIIVVKIGKGPSPPEQDSTPEVTRLEDLQSSAGDEPKASPEDLQEREEAAGTIQKAFKKYQTGKASKRVAEEAFSSGDTQREVWARRRAGQFTRAKEVEDKITGQLTDAPVTRATDITTGATDGTKLVATGSEKGVLKVGKGWPADSNAEVAAFKMDQLIGLNAVPVTVQRPARFYGVGVMGKLTKAWRKVFPQKVRSDRTLFLPERPVPAGEVPDSNQRFVAKAAALGRGRTHYVPHMQDIRFFDKLIGNPDRHGENVLKAEEPLETTGRPMFVAIDHGMAFRHFNAPVIYSEHDIPSEYIFERTKYMSKSRFERMLGPHLDADLLKTMWEHREALVNNVDSWIQKHGHPPHW